ncbi:DUF5979 domain-containing protein [Microbacterium koreense]|uniref:DUF5979 domain-containing protein n=1 Tax=Microbacterium koreense TaxID=323761 RepID=A0ABW2ZSV7_9MICO
MNSPRPTLSRTTSRINRASSARRARGRRGWRFASLRAFAVVASLALATAVGAVVTPSQPAVAASIGGVVNGYQKVSTIAGTAVTVTGSLRGASAPFAVGDRVMLIQMTGTAPVHGSSFGNYDVAEVVSVAGSTITLDTITRTYSPATEAVQLVRMPYDAGVTTVDTEVTAAPWNGSTGGIVALAGGTLTLNANIDAGATGFTNDYTPTSTVTPDLSSGPGSTTGRGFDGALNNNAAMVPFTPTAGGGGGIGGGGGTSGTETSGKGGGIGRGGNGTVLFFPSDIGAGTDGGDPYLNVTYSSASGAAGGGGGVIGGGGGGGGEVSSGGGGGTDGGGAGGLAKVAAGLYSGSGGGGGPRGVGNGADGFAGGPTGTSTEGSQNEGSAGAGGGSYGGGGGAPSNVSGGDDGNGGGGGGSWTGGGEGGLGGGGLVAPGPYAAGGDGNDPVADPLPDSAHYLNATNPRLMMGGAGGKGSQDSGHSLGGAGGGIVYLDFVSIGGNGDIRSDGAEGASPTGGGAHSGSGGGAGGQMRIRATTVADPIVIAANGGIGGAPTANKYHGGVSGGGGGAGGVWLELVGVESSCPAAEVPNVTLELAGGSGGPTITNPKNQVLTATGGAGGAGLGCVSPLIVPTGSLTLTKTIDDPDGLNQAETFPVDVQCVDPASGAQLTRTAEIHRDGSPTEVTDLPAGWECTVTETDTDGAEVTYSPPGPIDVIEDSAVAVAVTNTYVLATGSVQLVKEVIDPFPNDESGDAESFPVELVCTDPNGGSDIEWDGSLDRDGTPALISDLPEGAVCTVTELDSDGAEVSYDPSNEVTVVGDTTVTVTVINTFPDPALDWSYVKVAMLDGVELADGAHVLPGDRIDYRVTVTSEADVPVEDIVLTDDLSDVLDDASYVIDSGTLVVDGGTGVAVPDPVSATLVSPAFTLPPGGTATLEYAVIVDDDAWAATLRNVVTGESPTEPPTNPPEETTQETPEAGSVQWDKVDASANLLTDSEWELTPVDAEGNPTGPAMEVLDCIEEPCADGGDSDPLPGRFSIDDLTPGSYRLVEVSAPAGYVLDTTPHTAVIGADGGVFDLGEIVNDPQAVPAIPLTGGLGTDHYLMAGGALALLAALLESIRRRRGARLMN